MPLTARQLSTLNLKDQLALIYGQFASEPLSRNQFNNLDTFNDKITAIYLEIEGATLTRHYFSLLSRNEQMAEIYIALGGTKKRQAIIGYDLSSQLANIYIVCPDPTLTIRQFKALSLDMQLAHIYLAVGRLAAEEAEPAAPVSITPPTIDNTSPEDGDTLTVVAGTATGEPSPTASYSWVNATTLIEVGTGTTLVVDAADFVTANGASAPAKVFETWTNSEGGDVDESTPTDDVECIPFDATINLNSSILGFEQVAVVTIDCKAFPIATFGAGEWFLDAIATGQTDPNGYTLPNNAGSTYSWRGIITNAVGSTAVIESDIGTIT